MDMTPRLHLQILAKKNIKSKDLFDAYHNEVYWQIVFIEGLKNNKCERQRPIQAHAGTCRHMHGHAGTCRHMHAHSGTCRDNEQGTVRSLLV